MRDDAVRGQEADNDPGHGYTGPAETGWVIAVGPDPAAKAAGRGRRTFVRLEARGTLRFAVRSCATHVASEAEAEALRTYLEGNGCAGKDERMEVVAAGPSPEGRYVMDVRSARHGIPAEVHAGWVRLGPGGPERVRGRSSATAFADRASAEWACEYVRANGRNGPYGRVLEGGEDVCVH